MSSNVLVMPKAVKIEAQSPVKPEVLKPSNAANLQNITNKLNPVTSKALSVSKTSTNNFSAKTVLGKVNARLQTVTTKSTPSKISSSTSSSASSPQANRSPFKVLTPIRPSPTVRVSTPATPSSARTPTTTSVTLVKTPTSVTSSSSSSCSSSSSPGKCRRRINYSEPQPPSATRRNARERNRVKQVSQGFAILRQHVPHAARKKKLSKVETLRCAVEYIRGLQLLLEDHPLPSSQPDAASTSTVARHPHHTHEQLHHQVFLQPHPAIEPHILKLPGADETFQSPNAIRYDGVAGAFLRSSPSDSDGSPANSYYSHKFSPSAPSPLPVGMVPTVVKTENIEERCYGNEDQDLLEALAWWQHNI